MSDTPRWLAGWYATRLHAVDRPFDPSSIRPIYAMCNARVYASPQIKWAARRLAKNPPKCKRCVKLLGQADAPSEIARLRAEVERLRAATTNHDAAPAATAEVAPGTGHTQSDTTWEPLCWCCSGPGIQSFHESKADAEEYREHSGIADEVEVFQVGRAFALTEAERATLYHLRNWLRHIPDVRALLSRLGGDA